MEAMYTIERTIGDSDVGVPSTTFQLRYTEAEAQNILDHWVGRMNYRMVPVPVQTEKSDPCPECGKPMTTCEFATYCANDDCDYLEGGIVRKLRAAPKVDKREIVVELRKQYGDLVNLLEGEGWCTDRECMCDFAKPVIKLGAAITELERE